MYSHQQTTLVYSHQHSCNLINTRVLSSTLVYSHQNSHWLSSSSDQEQGESIQPLCSFLSTNSHYPPFSLKQGLASLISCQFLIVTSPSISLQVTSIVTSLVTRQLTSWLPVMTSLTRVLWTVAPDRGPYSQENYRILPQTSPKCRHKCR